MLPYLLVVTANLLFASSSLTFAHLGRSKGVLWINLAKTLVACVSSLLVLTYLGWWSGFVPTQFWPFFLSGFIGLAVGDMFLIAAFARIGSARTMVLFGFQPLFVAVGSYALFGEGLSPYGVVALFFLVSCLLTFSFENFKRSGRWEFSGLVMAVMGVLLDAIGLFLTRYGFQLNEGIHPLEGHFFRCLGAVLFFVLLNRFWPSNFFRLLFEMPMREKWWAFMACFFGTFVSLFLAMSAIQMGNLPKLAALSITTPLFTSMLEHLSEKRWPSLIFIFAFFQFVVGFLLLLE